MVEARSGATPARGGENLSLATALLWALPSSFLRPEPRSSPDFKILTGWLGLVLIRHVPSMVFHSLEAVRPTIAKAKVLTSEAEKEEGRFSRPEFRAHFFVGAAGGEAGSFPPGGPFWSNSGHSSCDGGAFPPSRLHSFSIRPLKAHPAQHTLALPEPPCNCLGSLQTPGLSVPGGG